jgi:hypothetical protein
MPVYVLFSFPDVSLIKKGEKVMKTGSFLDHFSRIPDPRSPTNRKHLLIDILFMTICAVICGAKGWEEIAEFGDSREDC